MTELPQICYSPKYGFLMKGKDSDHWTPVPGLLFMAVKWGTPPSDAIFYRPDLTLAETQEMTG